MSDETLTATRVKQRARELGAHLVGIATADGLAGETHSPAAVLNGAASVIVLARRFIYGGVLLRDSRARSHHYTTELGITELEDTALDLMYFLEDEGYPSLIVPAASSRSEQHDMREEGPLPLTHAAVAAGLGTLGLNEMLLTPEYGPRVILGAVVTQAALEPDERHTEALCHGETCGRCLLTCPGDAVQQWKLDVAACRPHSSPYGYDFFQEHVARIAGEDDPQEQWRLAQSTDSLMIWQSMLRGVGVHTGCTRCQDVCPVGKDYETFLAEALEDIPEETEEKRATLAAMQARAEKGERGPDFERNRQLIGEIDQPRQEPLQ